MSDCLHVSAATSTVVGHVFFARASTPSLHSEPAVPISIHAYLCLGACGRGDLLYMEDLLAVVTSRKRKQSEREPEDTDHS